MSSSSSRRPATRSEDWAPAMAWGAAAAVRTGQPRQALGHDRPWSRRGAGDRAPPARGGRRLRDEHAARRRDASGARLPLGAGDQRAHHLRAGLRVWRRERGRGTCGLRCRSVLVEGWRGLIAAHAGRATAVAAWRHGRPFHRCERRRGDLGGAVPPRADGRRSARQHLVGADGDVHARLGPEQLPAQRRRATADRPRFDDQPADQQLPNRPAATGCGC